MGEILEHSKLGVFEYADNLWEGSDVKLRRLRRRGWNRHSVSRFLSPSYDETGKRIVPSPGEAFAPSARPPHGWKPPAARLVIEADEAEPPNKKQEAAVAYLLDNQGPVLRQIAAAAEEFVRHHDYWEWMRETLGDEFGRLEKLLSRASGWLSVIDFREIRISDKTRREHIVVGFDCHCAWDGEHGWGIQLARDRVVETGYGDVGWNISKEPEFVEHPRLGKLEGSVPYWRCKTELLDQFIRCGWNEAEVGSRLAKARQTIAVAQAAPAAGVGRGASAPEAALAVGGCVRIER